MLKIGGNRTIVDLFIENVDHAPDKPFVRFAGTVISYAEMGRMSAQMAKTLAEAGIGHQSRVAISISNRPAFLVAFLGILRRGATVVPLNTLYKPDEARFALEHARCQAIVTEESLRSIVEEACQLANCKVALLVANNENEVGFTLHNGPVRDEHEIELETRPVPNDLAGIFYTSGTTARPKGVMISHENMMYSAEVTIKSLGLGQHDVPLLAFPLFHVNSLFYGILTAIVLQGAVGLVSGFSVSGYWKDAAQTGASWTPGITGALVHLLQQQDESEAEKSHSMKFAVGGMFMSIEQIQAYKERFGITLLPGWSMTETVSLGTLHPVSRPTPIPTVTGIGYPTLGQEIRLIRDDGSDAEVGEPGEILYRSVSIFGGYLDDEQATREAFTGDGWFRSGDVACMDQNGYLTFLDRKKEMIKTKGENVAAAEVERALNEHLAVQESAVIGVPDQDGLWGERIEAYVVRVAVAGADAHVDAQELMQWVGGRLADFKVPRLIHFIDQLPKTPLGKIQRQKLR
jgi:crotonobetaine/carnitine-CoA ligase